MNSALGHVHGTPACFSGRRALLSQHRKISYRSLCFQGSLQLFSMFLYAFVTNKTSAQDTQKWEEGNSSVCKSQEPVFSYGKNAHSWQCAYSQSYLQEGRHRWITSQPAPATEIQASERLFPKWELSGNLGVTPDGDLWPTHANRHTCMHLLETNTHTCAQTYKILKT